VDKELRDTSTSIRDQYSLLMLKGEAGLRAGQRAMAISAFTAAGAHCRGSQGSGCGGGQRSGCAESDQGRGEGRHADLSITGTEERNIACRRCPTRILARRPAIFEAALSSRTLNRSFRSPGDLEHVRAGGAGHRRQLEGRRAGALKLGKQTQQLIGDELLRNSS